ncbi:hypothetical protein LTR97_009967 [Elasticomyces elasticus]|uniref:Uncharacterized protein n=1 Tax=Elasticomyces elasticus TaxID=574655 RepID=A0AAN8A0S6_9PEZI|nr:hypothetical protein LTR97_009967 [Elasticomyces elasticus]
MSSAELAIEVNSDRYDSEVESDPDAPSPPPEPASVDDAIANATSERLRIALRALCRENEVARETASRILLVSASATATGKRKRYETCKNCKEEYDVQVNEKGFCVYHPGSKSVNEESKFWEYHRYEMYGEPCLLLNEPMFEEGMCWDCCEQSMSAGGCRTNRHKPAPAKKARVL